MIRARVFPVALGVSVLLVALSGCGDDAPPPAATPEPTLESPSPEPTAEAQVASIIIDGDSVYTVMSEGGVGVDIPFSTDPAAAAAQLSEAIGLEPITTTTPAASCGGGLTTVTWGAITFYSPYASAPPGMLFYAQADAEKTSNGITVSLPSGQWVGFDGSDTIAANASAPVIDFGMPGLSVLAYDVKAGTVDSGPDDFWGATAVIRDDRIESFAAPIHYYYDC